MRVEARSDGITQCRLSSGSEVKVKMRFYNSSDLGGSGEGGVTLYKIDNNSIREVAVANSDEFRKFTLSKWLEHRITKDGILQT